MRTLGSTAFSAPRRIVFPVVLLAIVVAPFCSSNAQLFNNQRSVGGISVNTDGLLAGALLDDMNELSRIRAKAMSRIPAELNGVIPLRKVSLRRLEAAIAKCGEEVPDEIKYLAGLQQIRYVFVYPEQQDIVLVGPAEGWKVEKHGNVVGITTGRPVMLLDDLLVALRTARGAAQGGISCSIDPTPEGLARLRGHVAKLRTIGNPQQTATGIENALGMQQVSFTNIPATSHFARVLVAADYRMKRLAMDFEPSPVRGLPGFLTMMKAGSRGMSNMLPRWWLEPDYEPLMCSPDGFAWELRGASVKALTEEDFLTATGNVQHSGRANPVAQRWAESMTEKYDELAIAEPIFGQLRNCMELAIVGALIVKEQLAVKAGYSMPILLDPAEVETDEYFAPRQIASQASLIKKGRNWVISASGGVLLNTWEIADKTQQSDAPAAARQKAVAADQSNWWWN